MKTPTSLALLALSFTAVALSTGCGAASHSMMPASRAAAQAPAPVPLDRSLFSRDVTGTVGETDLQRILSSSVDVTFPVRVGVV